jgi:DNA-binding MarR family transcriptional regulator
MTPNLELRYLILAAQRTGARIMTTVLKPLDLTPAQAEVLNVLSLFEPVSLARLGELLVCETGSPSRLVTGLVKRGLVLRTISHEDGRVVRLSLSGTGRALVGPIKALDDEIAARIGARLTPEETRAVIDGLRKLLAEAPPGQAVERRRALS